MIPKKHENRNARFLNSNLEKRNYGSQNFIIKKNQDSNFSTQFRSIFLPYREANFASQQSIPSSS